MESVAPIVTISEAREAESRGKEGTAYRLSYNLDRYPFRRCLSDLWGALPESLHQSYPILRDERGLTQAHREYYRTFDTSGMGTIYRDFVASELASLFPESIVFQRIPTLRIHMPGAKAVEDFHVDSEFGHQAGCVNFWLPVMSTHGTNALHLDCAGMDISAEADLSSGIVPVEVALGEVLRFDAVHTRHGNRINTTGETRVSIDFRIVAASRYRDSDLLSVTARMPLKLGGYYETMISDVQPRRGSEL